MFNPQIFFSGLKRLPLSKCRGTQKGKKRNSQIATYLKPAPSKFIWTDWLLRDWADRASVWCKESLSLNTNAWSEHLIIGGRRGEMRLRLLRESILLQGGKDNKISVSRLKLDECGWCVCWCSKVALGEEWWIIVAGKFRSMQIMGGWILGCMLLDLLVGFGEVFGVFGEVVYDSKQKY